MSDREREGVFIVVSLFLLDLRMDESFLPLTSKLQKGFLPLSLLLFLLLDQCQERQRLSISKRKNRSSIHSFHSVLIQLELQQWNHHCMWFPSHSIEWFHWLRCNLETAKIVSPNKGNTEMEKMEEQVRKREGMDDNEKLKIVREILTTALENNEITARYLSPSYLTVISTIIQFWSLRRGSFTRCSEGIEISRDGSSYC